MEALRWYGPRDVRLEELDAPPPSSQAAVVEVAYCGVCATDVAEYRDGPKMIRASSPHPLTGEMAPLVLGHEISGRVVEAPPGSEGLVGQRVCIDPCWRCGRCFWCRRGDYHLCRIGGAVGLISDGGLAGRVRAPVEGLVPLGDVRYDLGALVEPLAVALHAVRRGAGEPGASVVVVGYGPIGAAIALIASATGAGDVAAVDPSSGRRDLARRLGVTGLEATDPRGLRREVRDRTGGVGADLAFECSGTADGLSTAIDVTRKGGRVVMVGLGATDVAVSSRALVLYERDIVGSLGYAFDHQRVVDLLAAGRIDPSPLISARVPLVDGPELFEDMATGPGGGLKTLVELGGDRV